MSMPIKITIPADNIETRSHLGRVICVISTDANALTDSLGSISSPSHTSSQIIASLIIPHISGSLQTAIGTLSLAVDDGDGKPWEADLIAAYLRLTRTLCNIAANFPDEERMTNLVHQLRRMSGDAINGRVSA